MRTLFLLTAFLFTAIVNINAQKQFTEGKIVYATIADTAIMSSSLTKTDAVIYFKSGNVRLVGGGYGNLGLIADAKSGEVYTLINLLGRKRAFKMRKEDVAEMEIEFDSNTTPQVIITAEQKTIAGYKCTKAIITYIIYGDPVNYEVWYTKEIAPLATTLPTETSMPGLDGFVLENSVTVKGYVITTTCIEIKSTPVSNRLFKVPDSYLIKTNEELTDETRRFLNY